MANTHGAQALPFRVTPEGFPAGDIGLGYFGQFLQAAINAACVELFQEFAPGRDAAMYLNYIDPTKVPFEENRLPALYVWRGKSRREWLAADIKQKQSRIEVGWITEPSQEAHFVLRDPLMNAILDAVDEACFLKRCPSYVVTGDTDALAQTRGSLITTFTGFTSVSMSDGEAKAFNFDKLDGDGKPLPYYGFTFGIDVTENLTIDPSVLNVPHAIGLELTANGVAWSEINDPEPPN